MTSTTSRRAILAGIAAATIPLAATATTDATDGVLIALGKRHAELVAAYADAQKRSESNWAAWNNVLKQFGEWHDAGGGHISNDEYTKAAAKVDREYPVAAPTCDDCIDAIGEVADRIMALPAHTIAGLRAKAAVAKEACWEFYRVPFEDADWEDKAARSLIDAVLNIEALQS